jgi:hypothetical protein
LHIYDWVDSVWVKRATVPSPYPSFDCVSLSGDAQFLVVGPTTSDGGKVRAYKWNGSSWTLYGDLGTWMYNTNIKVSDDGNVITVAGVSQINYVFVFNGSSWSTHTIGTSSNELDFANPSEIFTSLSTLCYKCVPFVFSGIRFNTLPAIGDVITADYTVDGIHKTDQYVIDVSFAIQYGEGS